MATQRECLQVLLIHALSLVWAPYPSPETTVPAPSHKFWSPIHSRMGPTQKTLLSSGFLRPFLLPGGHGPFYSDYAALQRRLLNFSPPWSLIFTNRGTTAILRIAQPVLTKGLASSIRENRKRNQYSKG